VKQAVARKVFLIKMCWQIFGRCLRMLQKSQLNRNVAIAWIKIIIMMSVQREDPNWNCKLMLRNNGQQISQVLTEVCDNGSVFDLYSKQNMKFDREIAWRMARECAGHSAPFSLPRHFQITCS
jgi:hypothetical protein